MRIVSWTVENGLKGLVWGNQTFLDIWAGNPAHKQKHFTKELSLNNLKTKECLYSTTSKA
jgi:hypothetical protein